MTAAPVVLEREELPERAEHSPAPEPTRAEREGAAVVERARQAEADANELAKEADPRRAAKAKGWGKTQADRALAVLARRREAEPAAEEPSEEEEFTIDEQGRERDGDGTIVIRLRATTKLERLASLAVDALAEDGRVYQRAHRLVQLVRATPRAEQESAWIDSEGRQRFAVRTGAPMVDEIGRVTLTGILDTAATFKRYDGRVKKGDPWKTCRPEELLVSLVHEWKRWEGIAPLAGVADCPILRRDGTVCQRRGYDPQSGWWIDLAEAFPEVAEHPTREEARAAYALLARVFADFPYVTEAQRAVPIAAILTVVARAAIAGSVPAFVFDAASGRTGKTLQTDAIAFIATGRFAARKVYPPTDEEAEKVLAGYALSGTSLVCIDDIKRAFGGEVLDMIITARDEVDFRILGKTDTRRVPWRAVLLATGNNIAFLGQMAARVLVARLESPLERPQDRSDFTIAEPLPDFVRRERTRLVVAALTVLRGWTCKHLTSTLGRWGGFDEWAALVPPAIVFAGGPNVLDARPPDDGDVNPEAESLRDLVSGLAMLEVRASTVAGLTSAEIRSHLFERTDHGSAPEELRAMADALRHLTRAKPPADPTAAAIGYALRRFKGRVLRVEGQLRKLVSVPGHKGDGLRWQSVHVSEPGPTSAGGHD